MGKNIHPQICRIHALTQNEIFRILGGQNEFLLKYYFRYLSYRNTYWRVLVYRCYCFSKRHCFRTRWIGTQCYLHFIFLPGKTEKWHYCDLNRVKNSECVQETIK